MIDWRKFLSAILTTLCAGLCLAQLRPDGGGGRFGPGGRGGPGGPGFGGGGYRGGANAGPMVQTEGGVLVNEDTVRTARETASHSTGTPTWTNAPGFDHDVFTFARAKYTSRVGSRGWRGSWSGWLNDYPDSDLNLSFRLQQMSSMRVDPDGRVVHLNDSALFDFPMIFMIKPGNLELHDDEVAALRRYFLSGGMLWADDFWGPEEWDHFEEQMKRIFPERTWIELPMEHPVFHGVFNLTMSKNELQVPPIHVYERTGSSSRNGEITKDVHFRAWMDDRQRIMVFASHNTDNGDGWEREGEESDYFHKFSETRAYPLAINVIFYVMTH